MKLIAIFLMLAAATLSPATASGSGSTKMLFDFRNSGNSSGWSAVNDGVMGGLSKGGSRSTGNALKFAGTLSLENNGGFSSIRKNTNRNLSAYKGIRLRVKGDGRTYQLRMQTNSRYRSWPVAYSGDFRTKNGNWTEVTIPFKSMKQGFRGRKLKDYPFDPAKIELVGLVIGDKKAGPFALEVEWIQAY